MFKDKLILDSNSKTNRDRNCAEQSSLHALGLIFSGRCYFSLNLSITISTIIMAAALEWSESSLVIVRESAFYGRVTK